MFVFVFLKTEHNENLFQIPFLPDYENTGGKCYEEFMQ